MLMLTQLALTEMPEGACVPRSAGGMEGKTQWLEATSSAQASREWWVGKPQAGGSTVVVLAQCSMAGNTPCCSGLPAQLRYPCMTPHPHTGCACASPVMCPFLIELIFLLKITWTQCSPGGVKGNKVASLLECFEGADVEHNIKKYSSRLA